MPKENLLLDKSLHFAARIIKLHKHLIKTHKESVISKQIIRSGTSIGANINEGNYGSSKADFIAKMHIALKEAAETEYWIRLLWLSEYIEEKEYESLLKDCLDIKNMLTATVKTAKNTNS
jgi:four helix bundle protein